MITQDKKIGTAEYWDDFYTGKNTSKQDNSNTKRPENAFDRFSAVVNQVEGQFILDVGSGHARIPKMIKAKFPSIYILATDQSPEAKNISNYEPYLTCSGYQLPLQDNCKWDMIIITQALEYIEDQDKFMLEAKRVSRKVLITCPNGLMRDWSQFREYSEENLKEFIDKYADIEVFENWGAILMVKAKFRD